jgi:elongation factor 1-beta
MIHFSDPLSSNLSYTASVADLVVFEAVKKAPTQPHALRWYKHVKSLDHKQLPGTKKALSAYGPVTAAKKPEPAAKKPEPVEDDDDDIDLFGSDDEEDEENEKLKAARVAEYNAKKAASKLYGQ